MNEHDALKLAVEAAKKSPCQKSKRGVVLWAGNIFFTGFNHLPGPYACSGSDACRRECSKICVHAEQHALLRATIPLQGCELIHVKVVDDEPVPSGPPSCWQCSKLILAAGIFRVWLLRESGLVAYTATEFHDFTLQECGLPRTLR